MNNSLKLCGSSTHPGRGDSYVCRLRPYVTRPIIPARGRSSSTDRYDHHVPGRPRPALLVVHEIDRNSQCRRKDGFRQRLDRSRKRVGLSPGGKDHEVRPFEVAESVRVPVGCVISIAPAAASPTKVVPATVGAAGRGERELPGQELMIDAARITPVDKDLIPTGKLMPVAGTPFDFNKATAIGARIDADDQQLKFGGGYDHNWALNNTDGSFAKVGSLYDSGSGRVMDIYTTEPGLQFYSGNFLDGTATGKGGKVYEHRYALCLETQHFPDSANQPTFPSVVLRPGETYKSSTAFKFSTR